MSGFYTNFRKHIYSLISRDMAAFTLYFERLYFHSSISKPNEILFDLIENNSKTILDDLDEIPDLSSQDSETLIVLNGSLNIHHDIEGELTNLKHKLTRTSRIVAILYNPYLRWLFLLADQLRLRKGPEASTFITKIDLSNLAKLAGYDVVNLQASVLFPLRLFGLGIVIDRFMKLFSFLQTMSLVKIAVLRPIISEESCPSLSIVIPARNEMGNIESAIRRLPDFGGAQLEIIFVEGHSSDNTWEEIQRVKALYKHRYSIVAIQQKGKGKSDAVRLGFHHARCELVTILDADLTMPPELLPRFYNAYRKGAADFINGSRLVYPMEGDAMRFLNRIGNIFFAKCLSHVLNVNLGDTLCGTKLLRRADYMRMCRWREHFGDFDPFGDFELIFPASIFRLGIIDVPIRYLDRTYGSTNINRFRHGFLLLKMTLIGLWRIKLGHMPRGGIPAAAALEISSLSLKESRE